MPTDPSKLTKAKLKEELERYNIKLPPSGARKQAFIDLYNEHISQLNDPTIFDDDFDQQSENTDPEAEEIEEVLVLEESETEEESVTQEKEVIQETKKTMNVEDLSDKELADELRDLGFRPGPIGATTRRVYEKKLVKLRLSSHGSGDKPVNVSPKLFSAKYDEVPDDEEKQPPVKPRSPKRRPPPRRVPKDEPVEEHIHEPEVQEITAEPVLTRRPMTARHDRTRDPTGRSNPPTSSKTTPTSSDTQSNKTEKAGGIPMWVKVLILFLVCFFVYLVIVNMEPSADSKIPKSISDGTT